MKRSLLLVGTLVISVLCFSQKKRVEFGIQAGANYSTVRSTLEYTSFGEMYTTKSTLEYLPGFTGGVHAQIHLANHLYLQPEISYSQLGAKQSYLNYDSVQPTNDLTLKSILHYIVLPVLVKYQFGKTGAAVYAGPQVGYLLATTNKINNTTVNEEDNSNFKADFSSIFGAEYYFPLGLGISARYQLGFANIQKAEYVDLNSFPPDVAPKSISIRNNAFTVTIGYRF